MRIVQNYDSSEHLQMARYKIRLPVSCHRRSTEFTEYYVAVCLIYQQDEKTVDSKSHGVKC